MSDNICPVCGRDGEYGSGKCVCAPARAALAERLLGYITGPCLFADDLRAAADALERLTHDLAEAERMARLGNASTQQLRDALERAERRAEYWKAEHNAANAEANILARQVNAAEVIAEKARVFVAAQREAGEPDHTPDEASAYAALVAAIQRVRE